ncbi:MAG: substrate-binding domain-containing protein [Nitrospirae bacterium]|nr:substrate-binding domain-containing protein [Nitrospirota bacterium]
MGPALIVLGLCLFSLAAPVQAAEAEAAGSLAIAGNGPELFVIERLARAFEKANPKAYVDVLWDENSKPIELVKSAQAQIAVSGTAQPDWQAVQIAWDGIAIMVNLSNLTKEITSQQVADIFSGKVKSWSEVGGPDTRILLVDRPKNRNVREAFEQHLGIAGKIPDSAKVIGPDEKVIKTVAGTLPPLSAVTYLSLGPALEAVASGVAVRLLPIDKVEPEEPPVKDGRYKLRRPVLLLSKQEPNPIVDAFQAFALSKQGQQILDEVYIPIDQKP